jgi:UDP-N-acetyl-2-amino-2-deoxyglucuronate dehydrogenase
LSRNEADLGEPERAGGSLECERADVSWFLSIDRNGLPKKRTRSYQEIVAGRGFGLDEVRSSIEIVSTFRNLQINKTNGVHPFAIEGSRA